MRPRVIGTFGDRVDLLIVQGCDIGPFDIYLQDDETDEPIDLSDCVPEAWLISPLGVRVLNLSAALVGDPTEGHMTFTAASADTDLLPCGDTKDEPESQYRWEYTYVDADGHNVALYYGLSPVQRRGSGLAANS